MARKRKLAAAVFSLGCLHASSLMALGLGDLKLDSFLNEPLDASVDLLNMDGLHEDQIKIRLATTEDFDKLGLERAYFLTNITFDVVADGAGGARIVISSEKPVLEPYLDFVVEARWPSGRLLREYTVLVDPPVFADAPVAVSASQRVAEIEGIAAPESAAAAPSKKNDEIGLFTRGSRAESGETVVESTGTRVDIRDSNLAPGAMPQRNFNSSAAAAPTPGSRYMISRDDTLWQIADQAKPAGTSVHQEMLEIQRLNPKAFINANINRIKAGYIVYLPKAEDISATDLPTALAEVREQNAAWREGRDAELYASGPSLRISAEPEDQTDADAESAGATAGTDEPSAEQEVTQGASGAPGSDSAVSMAAGDAEARLDAAEEQLETLKRIVTLKDDQIAALQNALADAGVDAEELSVDTLTEEAPEELIGAAEGFEVDPVDVEIIDEEGAVSAEGDGLLTAIEDEAASEEALELESQEVAEPEAEEKETAEPAKTAPPPAASEPPVTPAAEGEGGWMNYLLYILGAVVLGVVGFAIARRRGASDEDEPSRFDAPAEDVFSDVELKQQSISVEANEIEQEIEQEPPADSSRDNRGYGEHKHDEYASDVDASDALAEADIYIAYGRHPQAIDLLNNALDAEPSNPVYRLKLLEIYNELHDDAAARAQLDKIRANGDADSIARAEALMSAAPARVVEESRPTESVPVAEEDGSPGLSPNPLEMMTASNEALESDFSGLEIEDPSASDGDDLDLSSDFAEGDAEVFDEEDLVIADESSGLSTKLDLARAYLDMGDDDGARQILDEVVAEGSEELKSEARSLLDRIGR